MGDTKTSTNRDLRTRLVQDAETPVTPNSSGDTSGNALRVHVCHALIASRTSLPAVFARRAGWLVGTVHTAFFCSSPPRLSFDFPEDRQFIAMKTHSILLIVCLLTAHRFAIGDDFTASVPPGGPALTPNYAPPDTLTNEPTRPARDEGFSPTPTPSLLPPSMIERTPYYEDSLQSGFGTGPRPAGKTGRFAPTPIAPVDEGFGTDGRNPRQRFEPGTGHDCSSHSPHRSHAPPSSLPSSVQLRYRADPAVGSPCQGGTCEYGYRGGRMLYRSRFQDPNESSQFPMSQFPRDGHDHSHGDAHSHGSHDQATASPNASQSRCPVDGATLGSRGRPAALLIDGQPVYLCSERCMMQLVEQAGLGMGDDSTEEHNHFHSH